MKHQCQRETNPRVPVRGMEHWFPSLPCATVWRPAHSHCMRLLETQPNLSMSVKHVLQYFLSNWLRLSPGECCKLHFAVCLWSVSQEGNQNISANQQAKQRSVLLQVEGGGWGADFPHWLLFTFASLCFVRQVSHSKTKAWAKRASLTCAGTSAAADPQQAALTA